MKRSGPLSRHTPLRTRSPMRRSRPKSTSVRKDGESTAAAQRKYWDFVASLPCHRCGCFGVQISHDNKRRGLGQKSAWWLVGPYCPECHRAIDEYVGMTRAESRAEHDAGVVDTFSAAMRDGILEVK